MFKRTLAFTLNFLKNPMRIGSIVPSSPEFCEFILHHANFHKNDKVLEIGTGTGAITKVLYEKMVNPTQYMGIELVPEFIETLSKDYPKFKFEVGSAEFLTTICKDFPPVDLVVCSLPWMLFPPVLQHTILNQISSVLKEGGRFTTYTYTLGLYRPKAKPFVIELGNTFKHVYRSPAFMRNIPPATVFTCVK